MVKRLMMKYGYILIGMLVALAFTACDYNAKYTTRKVELTMTQKRVSAGFAQFEFETDRPAYFLSGITQIDESTTELIDLFIYEDKFKMLMLDEAYIDYLEWRHDLLEEATHDIASFEDHTLKYVSAKQTYQFLEPNSNYVVYSFVVDPVLREPAGELHATMIHTDAESQLPICFSYRVNGNWDYVYPQQEEFHMVGPSSYIDENGQMVVEDVEPRVWVEYVLDTEVPWVGALVDSAWLREQGWSHPGAYFIDTFTTVSHALSKEKAGVHFGIYAGNNDWGSETSKMRFEQGHTYYAGMATLDGPLLNSDGRPVCYAIYRFQWEGEETQLYFMPGDSADTRGSW